MNGIFSKILEVGKQVLPLVIAGLIVYWYISAAEKKKAAAMNQEQNAPADAAKVDSSMGSAAVR